VRQPEFFSWALPLAMFSGAAALSHELLWTRRVTDVLGASYHSTATVFGCFFLGLALGSAWATRFTRDAGWPWLRLGGVEAGIALAAVPALTLTSWTQSIWPMLGPDGLLGWRGDLVKFMLSLLVVVPPAILMGMTLPLMVAAVIARDGFLSRHGIWIYATNTLGGVVGLLVTISWSLPWLGVSGAMSGTMGVNLLVATGCLWVHQHPRAGPRIVAPRRAAQRSGPSPSVSESPSLPATSGQIDYAGHGGPRSLAEPRRAGWATAMRGTTFPAALLVSFVSGLSILAVEILVLNLVFNVWPTCLYGTTAVLASVIVLLALTAWLTPWLLAQFPASPRLLALLASLAAVSTLATPLLFVSLTGTMRRPADTYGPLSFVLTVAAYVCATAGPGLFVSGLILPTTFAWHERGDDDRQGRMWGWLLAVNGVGGLVGATSANSLLLPYLGLHQAFFAVAAAYLMLAGGLARAAGLQRRTFLAAGLTLLLALAVEVSSVRRLPLMTPGANYDVVDVRCGPEGVVAVVDQVAPPRARTWQRSIVQSNRFQLGSLGARHSERRKMLLPLLLHRSPRRVAVIGLATGITAGAALDVDAVQSVDAVEISPLIARAAQRFFTAANRHFGASPRAHVVIEDGRTFLAASPDRYDVIVGDLFRPWVMGTGRLYSVEHFRSVRRALRRGGLFCQWLPMYQLDRAEFEAVLTTFLQVFPRADLIRGSFRSTVPAIGLVGLRDGQIDWQRLGDRCRSLHQSRRVRDPSLRRIEGVAMYYFGQVTADAALLPIVNTLNNPWIEIDAARRQVVPAGMRHDIAGMAWIRFVADLRKRARFAPNAPPEVARWSALGQKICMLHLARTRGSRLAAQLAEEINHALPADFYRDRDAAWDAWPVTRP